MGRRSGKSLEEALEYALRSGELTEDDWEAVERGLVLPFLEEHRPDDFHEGLIFYWTCWQELSPSRHRSLGGAAGIAYSEIRSWLDEHGVVSRAERDIAFLLVQRMDGYYLKRLAERATRDAK